MSIIYVDYEPVEIKAGTLSHWLFKQFPKGNVITLDTETSGLYIDGDWKDGPPARVSVVSMAWRDKQGELVTVALPFDQGKIGGKPGKWSDELDGYEPLEHRSFQDCVIRGKVLGNSGCVCAPWNLNRDDWCDLFAWLDGFTLGQPAKRIKMHHGKFDSHIMRAGIREDINCCGCIRHTQGAHADCYCDCPSQGVDVTRHWVWDTMLAQGIIEPTLPSSLKPTAERLWGDSSRDEERAVKEALKKNGVGLTWRYDLLAWDIIGPYAAKDAELTLKLAEHQEALISEGAVPELDVQIIGNELALAKLLFKMECRGVGFDAEGMRQEADKMEAAIRRIETQLPFEPTINAAKRYFFEELGIVPVKVSDVCGTCTFNRVKGQQRANTKQPLCTGMHKWNPALDGEVVARLAADKVPGAELYQHLANMNSALSKWYRAWPEKVGQDGRLRTNFRQGRIESDRKGMTSGGAISGRLSAERIQLQGVPKEYQLPKEIRGIKPKKDGTPGLIIAKPGHQLWEVDASNAEVRVAAWLAQCESLAAVINSGVNIHDGNTVALFGEYLASTFPGGWEGPIDQTIVNAKGERVFKLSEHPEWELFRTVCKTTIFGDLYGAGVRTLKAQIEMATKMEFPEARVKGFKDNLKAAYPELSRTARRCQAKADKSMGGCGYVRLVNGRKRVFGWAERTHKAFNACIQGGVAETMKTLMLLVEDAYPGVLINQVHDSLWLEVPDFNGDLIVADVQAIGAKLFTQTFSTDDLTVNFEFDAKRLA